jgi:ATP-dependent RNA helicase SUPV3L1/SUV3
MQKSGSIVVGSKAHVRLQRFLAWATVKVPDFKMRSNHNPDWHLQYASNGSPVLIKAAKAFQLGVGEDLIDAVLANVDDGLLARVLDGSTEDLSVTLDVFGVVKELEFGSIQHLLDRMWAMRLPDLQSPSEFDSNVTATLKAYVAEKIGFLSALFDDFPISHRAEILADLNTVIGAKEFVSNKIEALNEQLHELRYTVTLSHRGFTLELARKITNRADQIFTKDGVAGMKRVDQQELETKFQAAVEAAGEFNLANLGQKRVSELLMMTTNRMCRVIADAKEAHVEKTAFAALLSDPKFTEYHRLYPARGIVREWTAFLGPTNSGKTHNAINALANAKRGIYLSPLRLMALENQERIESMGIPCSLVTGEEQVIREGATHFCCTVEEFARFRSEHWDVVVIDEVQLLADPKRGWAWVDALVSAHTPVLMMTGPVLIESALKTLAEICEDNIKVVQTKRLSPVSVAKNPAAIKSLEKGSLVVAFSRRTVLELKGVLEAAGRTVSVVYGALSPEVRREQARRFRTGESDIMVATDAVGMGLNMPAHTVCFYTDEKFDGVQHRQLNVQEVKQIGGRAGRFGMAEDGVITAFENSTLKSIRTLFQQDDLPIEMSQFQIRPSYEHLESICEELKETSLVNAWQIFIRNINYGKEFVAVLPDEMSDWIEMIDNPNYPLALRWIFACTPVRGGTDSLAAQHAIKWIGQICNSKIIPLPVVATKTELASMEMNLHILETYIHLARSLPEFFTELEKAEAQKIQLNDSITAALSKRKAPSKQDKRILDGASKRCEKCKRTMQLLSFGHRVCQSCWSPAS